MPSAGSGACPSTFCADGERKQTTSSRIDAAAIRKNTKVHSGIGNLNRNHAKSVSAMRAPRLSRNRKCSAFSAYSRTNTPMTQNAIQLRYSERGSRKAATVAAVISRAVTGFTRYMMQPSR